MVTPFTLSASEEADWDKKQRIDYVYLHVDFKGGMVRLQHDGTNRKLTEMLTREGIPKDRIVLTFHRPELRQYTDCAVA